MSKYTHEQSIEITKLQIDVINRIISQEVAESEVLKIAPTFPIKNLKSYTSRLKKYLSGVGEYGFTFPANWAAALLEVTNNDELVIQAFKEQQRLYLEKNGTYNQRLANILNNL